MFTPNHKLDSSIHLKIRKTGCSSMGYGYRNPILGNYLSVELWLFNYNTHLGNSCFYYSLIYKCQVQPTHHFVRHCMNY